MVGDLDAGRGNSKIRANSASALLTESFVLRRPVSGRKQAVLRGLR